MGVTVGELVGGAVDYLFFTDGGRAARERLEPAVDDIRGEFTRFKKTIEKVADLANDGLRVVNEFNIARAQSFANDLTSH
jgi:hypothetical protein